MPERCIYLGPFVHCLSLSELDICESGAIGVDEDGRIAFIDRDVSGTECSKQGWESAKTIRVEGEGFFFPGFIDTHTHAPQFPNAGLFGSTTLLSWLETYTFPTESRFSSLPFAQRVYPRVVSRLLSHGTTCAAYYATTHVPATTFLAQTCLAQGQRAFVGRVCMDRMSPAYYRDESAETAVRDSEASIAAIRALDPRAELVSPILTPRFAPSCTPQSMKGLAGLAEQHGVRVQTHISENTGEIALVKELFPGSASYTAVYDEAGLLRKGTVLAHAVHLADEEVQLVKARGAGVSHCPCSNTCLASGACPVRKLLDAGVEVGLGTDVSGGYSGSMLEEVRQAVLVSRHRSIADGDEKAKLSFEEALWLATGGGARVMGLQDRVGKFEVGMEWDAQMVKLGQVGEKGEMIGGGLVELYGEESWEDKVAKWVYTGDDRNTTAVWVKGRQVHSREWVA